LHQKNPLAHFISKAQMGSPLVAGPPMCVDRPFSRDAGTVYGWGGGMGVFSAYVRKVFFL